MYSGRQDDTLYIMTYTLNSGIKGTVPLSNKQIIEWLDCYRNEKRFVTEIGKEFFWIECRIGSRLQGSKSFIGLSADHYAYTAAG